MAVSGTKKPNGHLFQNKNSKSLSPSPKDNHINPSLSLSLQPGFCFLPQETQERGIFLKHQEKWQTTNRKKPGEEEERKIAALTVPRNGAILKNIFVISKSPLASPESSEPSIENEENIQETEEILTFGRHSDCNIV